MPRLFKRASAVTLTRRGESVIMRDMRVKFAITKTDQPEPNECDLTIYNLAPSTRRFLAQDEVELRVDVGYEGQPLARIFQGDVFWAFSQRIKSGWETTVQAKDGHAKWKTATVRKSFRRGTPARRALDELARALDLKVPKNVSSALLDQKFLVGMSLDGSAADQMTKLMDRVGLTWSIQDGRLQILAPTEVHSGFAIVVSQDTGMVGSPQLSPPTGKSKATTVTARMLVEARARPGGIMHVSARSVDGQFKMTRVDHNGDTGGPEWETALEGVTV